MYVTSAMHPIRYTAFADLEGEQCSLTNFTHRIQAPLWLQQPLHATALALIDHTSHDSLHDCLLQIAAPNLASNAAAAYSWAASAVLHDKPADGARIPFSKSLVNTEQQCNQMATLIAACPRASTKSPFFAWSP